MKNKRDKKDTAFNIFSSVLVFATVYSFALLRKLSGEPVTKMFVDFFIVILLVVLNVTVLVLHETTKQQRREIERLKNEKSTDTDTNIS